MKGLCCSVSLNIYSPGFHILLQTLRYVQITADPNTFFFWVRGGFKTSVRGSYPRGISARGAETLPRHDGFPLELHLSLGLFFKTEPTH